MVQKLESCRELFLTEWVDSGSVYLPGGKLPTVGERVSNGQVAATYRRILEEAGSAGSRDTQIDRAFDAFTKASLPRRIDQYVATTEVGMRAENAIVVSSPVKILQVTRSGSSNRRS